MRVVPVFIALLCVTTLLAQVQPTTPDPSKDPVYFCPMDKDVRSNTPGTCSRCGMKLVAGVPDPVEFHLDLSVTPRAPRPGEKVRLRFEVHDPWKNNLVKKFNLVHEQLFHAFIVSEDLQVFVHDHPVWRNNAFEYDMAFPKPGMYRILGDFYPEGATPQLAATTIFVEGAAPNTAQITRDYSPKNAENIRVQIVTNPAQPVAGMNTQIRFTVAPGDGLEKYLGAWGHLLAASDDLIDMVHTHPFLSDGSPEMQFDLTFARPRTYRIWVQFQRKGIVNTAHFDIPVKPPAL